MDIGGVLAPVIRAMVGIDFAWCDLGRWCCLGSGPCCFYNKWKILQYQAYGHFAFFYGIHFLVEAHCTKTFFCVFLCLSYVCFVPVSNLLDMYSSIWWGVFSSKFLFVTDPKPKFGWRVFGGPRSPKKFHVLGDPKIFTKTLQCCWGCLDLAMPLGLSNFQIYFTFI